MIKVKHYKEFNCDPLGDKPVMEVMKRGTDCLERLGVTYWVSAGSVLGLVREPCGYIKYDTDIDVEIFVDDKLNGNKLLKELEDNNFEIIREMKYEDKIMQLAFMSKEDIIFDIYFYYENNTSKYVNYNEAGKLFIPRRFIINRELYKGFRCPSPILEYVEYRYGTGWRIPTDKKLDWRETAGEALKK